ncbi:hypothetical protein [Actinomadura verrucosospora]|uniref:Uncharacterized protein n=1 Tax=Actinomadura verrucosospora TaxID=46165 RepID=A0A7D3VTU0_ACTVE|nr:hypothetical protein [Actinomadura verrucosospora]QKG22618.1 hypothetical protein ACTIVE_4259 [Actinomadura verrucosospora]
MRPDGDPDPDDYGLPHVDVVVPDDARELDRDVLAYRREERRRRRRRRARRVLRPVTRFGVAIPIIAGALLVALISGALMTAFGPRPAPRPKGAALAPSPTAPPGEIGGLLPAGSVDVVNHAKKGEDLREMRPAVFGIMPPGSQCPGVVAALAGSANEYGIRFLLVADSRPAGGREPVSLKDVRACAGTAHDGTAEVLEDSKALLAGAYAQTPGTAGTGLTAVFVQPDGVVKNVEPNATPGPALAQKVKSLGHG